MEIFIYILNFIIHYFTFYAFWLGTCISILLVCIPIRHNDIKIKRERINTLKSVFNPFIIELEKYEPIAKNIVDKEIPKHEIAMLNFSHYLKGKQLILFNSERTWYKQIIEDYKNNDYHDSVQFITRKFTDFNSTNINKKILSLIDDIFKIAEGEKIYKESLSKKEINNLVTKFMKKH